jgi:nucleoside-diphosphate-sugar epimerase
MSGRLLGDKIKSVFVTGGAGFIGSHLWTVLSDQYQDGV